jgi:hypothetical protein
MQTLLKTLTLATAADHRLAFDSCLYARKESSLWVLASQWDIVDILNDYYVALENIVYS